MGKNALRLVEIQESVLPEDEWIIGVSVLDYFNGVGYSMPQNLKPKRELGNSQDSLSGGVMTADVMASSNLEDSLKIAQIDDESDEAFLMGNYRHVDDSLLASSGMEKKGVPIDHLHSSMVIDEELETRGLQNLYAFIPGIFYCSGQQTSVDAVLIEVTQKQRFGVTLSSFRPEDVRTLDISAGFILDKRGSKKAVKITVDALGSFHFDGFLKDSGISAEEIAFSKEIDMAQRLSRHLSFEELKKAYVSSSFLRARLMKLLEDINFYGLEPRRRIYLRNEKHPHGRVIDVVYRGFDSILDLGVESGIACIDETELERQLNGLVFTKLIGTGIETNIESAIMEMLRLVETRLDGQTSKEKVLVKLSQEADR